MIRKQCGLLLGVYPDTYASLPGLSFDAAKLQAGKKKSDFLMETPNSMKQVRFLQQGIRGGFANNFQKFFCTGGENGIAPEDNKNPGFPRKEYAHLCQQKQGRPFIVYLDAINLYV